MLQDSRSPHEQGVPLAATNEDLAPPNAAAVDTPFQVGADLRAARERLGLDLKSVATYLHIRRSLLEAIELGRFADLPAPAYTIGHVRAYACALGLHPDEITSRFRAEAATRFQKPKLKFPVPLPERGLPAGAAVLIGMVMAVSAYAGWWNLSASPVGEEPVHQVPQRLAALVQPPPPPAPLPAPRPQTDASFPLPASDTPSVPPTSAAAAAPASGVYGPPLSAASAVVPPSAGLPPLPEGTRVVLLAQADAWVQVRDRQGRVMLNRVLRAGETWPVPPGRAPGQLLMTTGNAGGTEILVDGQTTASLGGEGVVRRNLALDPDAILSGSLAPVAAATPRRAAN